MMDGAVAGQAQRYSAVINEPRDAEVRKTTEMESLSALLGENRSRLRAMMELIEARLDHFDPRPQPASTEAPTPPEPSPGTLPCLRWMAETTSADLSRLDAICMRLRDLL
jgi:hypothetical protein